MKKSKIKLVMISVFVILSFACLALCNWISGMSFFVSSEELKIQQMKTEISDIIDKVDNSLEFGKALESYYGMDEVLAEICATGEGLDAVIQNSEGDLLYTSCKEGEEEKLFEILSEDAASDYTYLNFPIGESSAAQGGNLKVAYLPEMIAAKPQNHRMFLGTVLAVMVLLYLFVGVLLKKKKHLYLWMNILVISGMCVFSFGLYQSYKQQYEVMIQENVQRTAEHIAGNLSELLEKGMDEKMLPTLRQYLSTQIEKNEVCKAVVLTEKTKSEARETNRKVICQEIPASKQWKLQIEVDQAYQARLLKNMILTFLSIILITLMIALELFRLIEIVERRLSEDFNTGSKLQKQGMSRQIKLLSFFTYVGIYLSISYTAVIMREQSASIFGLSPEVSSSLPLTMELLMMMVFSLLLAKIDQKVTPRELLISGTLILIVGNLSCTRISNPYLLLILRTYCGIGFAFLKYFLNIFVAAASDTEYELNYNYAGMNAGVLGGITAGAALGGVLAGTFGYQANYGYTLAVVMLTALIGMLCIPWQYLKERRTITFAETKVSENRDKAETHSVHGKGKIYAILFAGSVPLNIGLMYVVSFLPVYMNSRGCSPLSISYAYLINGAAGIYVGASMVKILRKLSGRVSATAAFLLGGAGILVLVLGNGIGLIFLSAGLMGLFDGYGTPSITGAYTNYPALKEYDKAQLLTTFNTVGNGVQILCPMLYNLMIQPDGKTLYLTIFGIVFLLTGGMFYFLLKDEKRFSRI